MIAVITTPRAALRWTRLKKQVPDAVPVIALPLDHPEVVTYAAKYHRPLPEVSHRLTLARILMSMEGDSITVLEDDTVFDTVPDFSPVDGIDFKVYGTYIRWVPEAERINALWVRLLKPLPMWGSHAVTYSRKGAERMITEMREGRCMPDAWIGQQAMVGLRTPMVAWQMDDVPGMHGKFRFGELRRQAEYFMGKGKYNKG